jgi:hypothetical protein
MRTRVFLAAALAALAIVAGGWWWLAETRVSAGARETPAAVRGPRTAFDAARAMATLRQLVAIGPRPSGSAEIREARALLTRQLSAIGLTVQEQPFIADTPVGRVEMANLIVRLPGRVPDRLVLAGHYDTKLYTDRVFVGANDGASSAAFLVELARVLAATPHELTYDLVWFDGEEAFVNWMGYDHTYGSRYYVQAAEKAGALAQVRALVLVDMIADRDLQIRRDAASTRWLNDVVWETAKRIGYGHVFVDAHTQIEDDHQPFMAAGVPSIDIIDLEYPPWHTPADDLAHVSADSLQVVGDVVVSALPAIEARLAADRP